MAIQAGTREHIRAADVAETLRTEIASAPRKATTNAAKYEKKNGASEWGKGGTWRVLRGTRQVLQPPAPH